MMPLPPPVIIGNATLYTFAGRGFGPIKVVRLTDADADPDDWATWPDRYARSYPDLGDLQEVAAVEIVDCRGVPPDGTAPVDNPVDNPA